MAHVHISKGRIHAKNQELDRALEHFDKARNHWKVRLDAEDSDTAIMTKRETAMAEFYIAIVLEKQGKYSDAVKYHQQAFDRLRGMMSIEDPDLRKVADGLVAVKRR